MTPSDREPAASAGADHTPQMTIDGPHCEDCMKEMEMAAGADPEPRKMQPETDAGRALLTIFDESPHKWGFSRRGFRDFITNIEAEARAQGGPSPDHWRDTAAWLAEEIALRDRAQGGPSLDVDWEQVGHDMHRHFWPGSVAPQHGDPNMGDCYKCRRMGEWLAARLGAGDAE